MTALRGGRRPGAGRPPEYIEPLVRTTITLPLSYLEPLRNEGKGNLSEGIRFVIEQARTPGGYYWFAFGRENPPPGPLFPYKPKTNPDPDPSS